MLDGPSHIPDGPDGKLLGKILENLAELSIDNALKHLNMSRGKQKIILKGEQEMAMKELLAGHDVMAILPTGFSKSCSIAKEILMVFLSKGRRQTLSYCYKCGRGKHFVLRKIRKTATNKSIIAQNRTLTSMEP